MNLPGNSPARLPEPWGRFIQRDTPLEFRFDGKTFQGFAGDTVSSALAGNGCWVLGRSFKYHRPRGSVSFSGWDANAYVRVGQEPNVNADLRLLEHGLEVQPQNVLGSLGRDWGAAASWFKPLMPVGFYYRAFFKPRWTWNHWEKLIRRAAGLGRVDPDAAMGTHGVSRFDKQYLFADVAVIGGGPAGLSAALEAAGQGKNVVLIEESRWLGGSLNYARFGRAAGEVAALRNQLVSEVEGNGHVRVLCATTCSGWFADGWLSLASSNRLYKLRADRVVLATGSVEQPAVFRNNDLPGVLPASTVQRLMRLYGVRPGQRAVVLGDNIEAKDVAEDLDEAGVEVVERLSLHRLDRVEALTGKGNRHIRGVQFEEDGSRRVLECDLLVTAAGYAPLGQLACHDGGHLSYDQELNAFRVTQLPENGDTAGSVNHVYDLDMVLEDGRRAGARAAGASAETVSDAGAINMNVPLPMFPHPKGSEFIDFDEDQSIKDLQHAVLDGFEHPELAKRYSTTAMGPSQGRLSATNAFRVVSEAVADPAVIPGQRITTQRPPFRPISMGLLAGQKFEPERLTAVHDWHLQQGAQMMPAGLWQRPAFYGSNRDQAIREEVSAVRESVGLIDVSTLGGIEVRGPDAALFLERMYTQKFADQPVGRTRYALMLDEAGSITDDGVVARWSEEHFYLTTTTTGSDAVYREMLRRSAEWRLQIDISNVTTALAAFNLAGPRSRAVIEQLSSDIDFSAAAFPYLACRQGVLAGVPANALRVGFVGELGYELHVPFSRAAELWEVLMNAGADNGIRAFGVEAQRLLRLEKGHIIVGQDTDGLTHPAEAAMPWAIGKDKDFFVGQAAVRHFGEMPLARKLVGFEMTSAGSPVPEECNLVLNGENIAGRVTSAAFSEALQKIIGLAYVALGDASPGSMITIKLANGSRVNATVCKIPFYDPKGRRQEL